MSLMVSSHREIFSSGEERIDWNDIHVAVLIGVFFVSLRGRLEHNVLVMLVILLCFFYMGCRARNDIGKLKQWGLTLDRLGRASLVALGLAIVATIGLGTISYFKTDELKFDPKVINQMVLYIKGAFPQQFLVFGMVLGNLSRHPWLSGRVRLPLLGAFLFAVLHFHAPLMMIGTSVLGFACVSFFLYYRTIIPLIFLHAYLQPLNVYWIRSAFEF